MWHAAGICCLLIVVACLALSRYHIWTLLLFRRLPTLFGAVAPEPRNLAHWPGQPDRSVAFGQRTSSVLLCSE